MMKRIIEMVFNRLGYYKPSTHHVLLKYDDGDWFSLIIGQDGLRFKDGKLNVSEYSRFDKVLTEEEIQSLYHNAKSPLDIGSCIAWYRLGDKPY